MTQFTERELALLTSLLAAERERTDLPEVYAQRCTDLIDKIGTPATPAGDTMPENPILTAQTPKEFAKMCRDALACREASWNDTKNRYMKPCLTAAAETCPEPWAPIVACLLTAGYADVWEWCDKVEKQ